MNYLTINLFINYTFFFFFTYVEIRSMVIARGRPGHQIVWFVADEHEKQY